MAVRRNGSENVFPTPGKVTGHPVRRDDVVVMESGGCGGYGDPIERDPQEAVRADVREGFVSAERARDGYGVVLDAAGEVDEEATAAAREALMPWSLERESPTAGQLGKTIGNHGAGRARGLRNRPRRL